MLSRIARDTAITCGLMVVVAIVLWPSEWRRPLGVVGGSVLIALSLWSIRGTVDAWIGRAMTADRPLEAARFGRGLGLVKFFTRYAMLGLAAYVMMARLHLDPVGMLAGASALGVAAGIEASRGLRAWRRLL